MYSDELSKVNISCKLECFHSYCQVLGTQRGEEQSAVEVVLGKCREKLTRRLGQLQGSEALCSAGWNI